MPKVFLKCAVIRTLSIAVIQTYFVPDEYWQSLEVAHASTFGYGYYTWEYQEKLRSFAYPSIFCLLYQILKYFHIDYLFFIVHAPRLLQAILTATADRYYYYWCKSLNLPLEDVWVTIIFDWFLFYCGSRTLINTLETNLVVFGISYFPWYSISPKCRHLPVRPYMFAVFVTISCFIRPTASVIWGPFCLMWLLFTDRANIKSIIKALIIVAGLVIISLVILDYAFYNVITLTPWNFLYFNIFMGVASFYGSHPAYWYILQGIPVVLGAFTLPFCMQLFEIAKKICFGYKYWTIPVTPIHRVNLMILPTIICAIFFYSLVPHKEFRFILPLSPMMMLIALQGINTHRRWRKSIRIFIILGFIVPTVLFGQLHQRGPLPAARSLATDAANKPNQTSILILTPCHAMPFYSHLHVKVPVRFITCEPPLTSYHQDESELFFVNPLDWLINYWGNNSNILPTHIVMFDCLAVVLHDWLHENSFIESETFFHTLFPEGRIGRYITIYRNKNYITT